MPRLLAAAYDWMYDFLGTDTASFNGQLRTNLLYAMRRTMLYYAYEHPWMIGAQGHWGYSKEFYNRRLSPAQRKKRRPRR